MQLYKCTNVILLFSSIFVCKTGTASGIETEYLQVNTSYGPVKGLIFTSLWTKETIYAFRGIPYATPPTGNLRFKESIPPEKWSEVKDCTMDRAYCYQPANIFTTTLNNKMASSPEMSEDCLFLNVYTSDVKPQTLMPVMVWIHGGAYEAGSSAYSNYGPDYLVAEGVVVVTINYRLGSFGLLTLGTAEAPGNQMLKDQRLALLWVQQEIQKFGGDPTQVTLAGQSSGSASVHLHYLSPLSKDLFHRAIAHSGPGLAGWSARDDGPWYGLQLARILNCSTSDMSVTLNCLQSFTADAILEAQTKVSPNPKDDTKGWTLKFTPSVDSWSFNPFLPELPQQLIEKHSGSHVPILMGTVRDEASINILALNESTIELTPNHLDKFIPATLREKIGMNVMDLAEERINEFYFNGTKPSYSNLEGFVKLNTDAWFMYLSVVSARYYREITDVYLYYFTFDGSFKDSTTFQMQKAFNISLIAHAEDLSYLFVIDAINQNTAEDSNEKITWKRMVKMWTNFVKYGVPTKGSDALLQNVEWLPVNNNFTRYLHIDVNLTMVNTDYLADRVAFWDTLPNIASSANYINLHLPYVVSSLMFYFVRYLI